MLEWHWQLGIAAAPAAPFLFLMLGNAPSPRWLAIKGRLQEARDALERLGVSEPGVELNRILQSLQETLGAGNELTNLCFNGSMSS